MLDRIIRFSIYNKVVIAVMTIALVVWGLWGALRLPIDAVPDITNNQVQIITVSPTLAGQEVEVARGVTELGYTAIVPVEELPQEAVIITKGAFFVYAKLSGSVAHNH